MYSRPSFEWANTEWNTISMDFPRKCFNHENVDYMYEKLKTIFVFRERNVSYSGFISKGGLRLDLRYRCEAHSTSQFKRFAFQRAPLLHTLCCRRYTEANRNSISPTQRTQSSNNLFAFPQPKICLQVSRTAKHHAFIISVNNMRNGADGVSSTQTEA